MPLLRAGGIRAGDRLGIDDRPVVVLGASGTVVRSAGDDGVGESASIAALAGTGRMVLAHRGTEGFPGARTGLAGLPPEAVAAAQWWEAHIIEVAGGVPPDAPPGTPPRPAYDVERTSLRAREQAKAAELSAAGTPVSASTVKHRRQRWQAEGLMGLVDTRVMRHKSPAGRNARSSLRPWRKRSARQPMTPPGRRRSSCGAPLDFVSGGGGGAGVRLAAHPGESHKPLP